MACTAVMTRADLLTPGLNFAHVRLQLRRSMIFLCEFLISLNLVIFAQKPTLENRSETPGTPGTPGTTGTPGTPGTPGATRRHVTRTRYTQRFNIKPFNTIFNLYYFVNYKIRLILPTKHATIPEETRRRLPWCTFLFIIYHNFSNEPQLGRGGGGFLGLFFVSFNSHSLRRQRRHFWCRSSNKYLICIVLNVPSRPLPQPAQRASLGRSNLQNGDMTSSLAFPITVV